MDKAHMPLQFVPTPISFNDQDGTLSLTANDGATTIEVTIEKGVVERLAPEEKFSKDVAVTALVRHQKRLGAVATRIFERLGPRERRIVIKPADLDSESG